MPVQLNYAANRAWIALEMAAPEGIAEHNIRTGVRAVLVSAMKESAQIRLNP